MGIKIDFHTTMAKKRLSLFLAEHDVSEEEAIEAIIKRFDGVADVEFIVENGNLYFLFLNDSQQRSVESEIKEFLEDWLNLRNMTVLKRGA